MRGRGRNVKRDVLVAATQQGNHGSGGERGRCVCGDHDLCMWPLVRRSLPERNEMRAVTGGIVFFRRGEWIGEIIDRLRTGCCGVASIFYTIFDSLQCAGALFDVLPRRAWRIRSSVYAWMPSFDVMMTKSRSSEQLRSVLCDVYSDVAVMVILAAIVQKHANYSKRRSAKADVGIC